MLIFFSKDEYFSLRLNHPNFYKICWHYFHKFYSWDGVQVWLEDYPPSYNPNPPYFDKDYDEYRKANKVN